MQAEGFRSVVLHASPDGGLAQFRQRLRTEPVDAVVIGGGVAANPDLADFKQQIIDAAREEAPQVKVLDFDHSLDVPVLVRRAFGMV